MAAVPLDIEADVSGLDPRDPAARAVVRGQSEVAITPGTVEEVRLVPADPPAYPESVAAIRSAAPEPTAMTLMPRSFSKRGTRASSKPLSCVLVVVARMMDAWAGLPARA